MRRFSVIIPVYNRPNEIDELLESLTTQTVSPYEVLVIDDGSSENCKEIVEKYSGQLNVLYFYKENSGQGFSRNFGFERATGDYFIIFDSDCIIPNHYFETVNKQLDIDHFDAFGGPDRARKDFTIVQRAINYSMTSPITTGGIRGRKKHAGTFHPRSFNSGISRQVFEKLGGFQITRKGEDIEYSIRIIENGFNVGLIEEAYVFHKRRTSLVQFFKQLKFFGESRINVSRFYPREYKLVHKLPIIFLISQVVWISSWFWSSEIFYLGVVLNGLFILSNFLMAIIQSGNLGVAIMAVLASYTQLIAYGIGLVSESLAGKRS